MKILIRFWEDIFEKFRTDFYSKVAIFCIKIVESLFGIPVQKPVPSRFRAGSGPGQTGSDPVPVLQNDSGPVPAFQVSGPPLSLTVRFFFYEDTFVAKLN